LDHNFAETSLVSCFMTSLMLTCLTFKSWSCTFETVYLYIYCLFNGKDGLLLALSCKWHWTQNIPHKQTVKKEIFGKEAFTGAHWKNTENRKLMGK